ncbi:cupredoxin domain-containing protein [Streptomyces sp. NPDC004609]|uniref:cupredoxin domain-containing protein n=1 Tax=Streptomyces sp. NPDC004609 TaxID=3364704 RepID=UPI0036995896
MRIAAIAGTLCLLALTGCSNGGGSSSPATPTTRSPTESPTKSATGPATAPATASSPAGGRAVIVIKNFTFTPASLAVAPGTQVTVRNEDSVPHTVTATGAKPFDTGDIAAGATTTFTAPGTAGDYAYICTIHPYMKGRLTVR